jgi:predicted TIM-barrel fold metal-dependent hydrolase
LLFSLIWHKIGLLLRAERSIFNMAAYPIFDACTYFGPWPHHEDLTLDAMGAVMKHSGVARAMVTSTTGIFYDFRAGNEAVEQAAHQNTALLPVGTLDPRAYPACVEEAKRCAAAGFRMMRFYPDRQGWPLRYWPFRELLQVCDALKLPVAVNVSRPGDATELADAVAFTQAPLLLAGATAANLGEVVAVLKSSTKFHLETTHFVVQGALEAICAAMPDGAARLVFASQAPLRYFSAALGPVLASGLTQEQKAAVLGGNLKRLVTH